ncbi:unnamed protein product [Prorocentrum cordatum]|uniref:Hexosyltransferase n=1 Tax=Prorocentrum cordatum TaxID=2364126 RepID=A0ABN9VT08_9DINO|nr:unnamed protein product [Polarella glacialis]
MPGSSAAARCPATCEACGSWCCWACCGAGAAPPYRPTSRPRGPSTASPGRSPTMTWAWSSGMRAFFVCSSDLCWAHSCCDPRHGPRGDPNCWDEIYSFDMCCRPEGSQPAGARAAFAGQVAHHMWKRSMWFGALEPPICPNGGAMGEDQGPGLRPGLPGLLGPPAARELPVAPAPNGTVRHALGSRELVVVVMSQLAALRPGGRVAGALQTWARRVSPRSAYFVTEEGDHPVGSVLEGDGRIPCPDYWLLDCNTYTASIYLGHYGLQGALLRHPRTRWFAVFDDDVFLNPYALGRILRGVDAGAPVCLGAHERGDRPLLSYWSGIVCSNPAVRLLAEHLEAADREVVRRSLGYSAGDFIISKCLTDLGVPLVDVPGFYGGNLPLGGPPSLAAATFHRVRTEVDFRELDGRLFGGSG